MLGTDGQPLPHAHWSPLFLAAEASLVQRSGLLSFGHAYFRQAVRDRYLPTDEQRRAVHARLADYFHQRQQRQRQESDEFDPRALDELSWQLAEAADWERLYELLRDRQLIGQALRQAESDVRTGWVQLEAHSPHRLIDAYLPMTVDDVARDPYTASRLVGLLSLAGHDDGGIAITEAIVAYRRQQDDRQQLASELRLLAFRLSQRARDTRRREQVERAFELLEESERLCLAAGDVSGRIATLQERAETLARHERYPEALDVFHTVERLCQETNDLEQLAECLREQADVYCSLEQSAEALAVSRREAQLARELDDPEGLARSLESQATVARKCGEYETALACNREAQQLRRAPAHAGNRFWVRGGEALILMEQGRPEEALAIYREQEQVCRQLGFRVPLANLLHWIGDIELERGNRDGALACYREREQLYRSLGDLSGLRVALSQQGHAYWQSRDYAEGLERYRAEEEICRTIDDPRAVASSLTARALPERARPPRGGSGGLPAVRANRRTPRRHAVAVGIPHFRRTGFGWAGRAR